MKSYSIAIRTLGLNPEILRRELISIKSQTIKPERVIIYIAEGYPKPDFQIYKEEYIWVKKGMVSQRVQDYGRLGSEAILLLDDDMELQSDAAENLLYAMDKYSMSIVGAEVYHSYNLPFHEKLYNAIINLYLPHFSSKWGIKQHVYRSQSYLLHPEKDFYPTQHIDGCALLCKTDFLLNIRWEDELWLDKLGFAYGDDSVLSYKAFINGYPIGLLFNPKINHLNGQTASRRHRLSPKRFYIRTKAMFISWWRMHYKPLGNEMKGSINALLGGVFKALWLIPIMTITSIIMFEPKVLVYYFKGLKDGYKFVHSQEYSSIQPYKFKPNIIG